MHSLYRHFDTDGILLYVGESVHAVSRLYQHMREAKWADQIRSVTIEPFATRDAAIAAETKAIQDEKPRYNISLTRRKGFFDQDREELLRRAKELNIKVDHRWSTITLRDALAGGIATPAQRDNRLN